MSDQLRRSLAALLGRVAHDLKNPLSVIVANLRFLEAVGDEDQREAAQESSHAAERLTRMIDDLAQIERLRSGERQPVIDPIALTKLAEQLRLLLEPQLGSRKLEIALPDATFATDPEILSRVLLNLLEHGLRQTPARGLVRLEGCLRADELTLEVRDGGLPFDPARTPSFLGDELPGVAEPPPGHRSDQGLALFVAGTAARALGAELSMLLADGGGARFEIRLRSGDA
jgi:signal transduction histidine kinase